MWRWRDRKCTFWAKAGSGGGYEDEDIYIYIKAYRLPQLFGGFIAPGYITIDFWLYSQVAILPEISGYIYRQRLLAIWSLAIYFVCFIPWLYSSGWSCQVLDCQQSLESGYIATGYIAIYSHVAIQPETYCNKTNKDFWLYSQNSLTIQPGAR